MLEKPAFIQGCTANHATLLLYSKLNSASLERTVLLYQSKDLKPQNSLSLLSKQRN